MGAISPSPAAVALARFDLPGGAMREVSYQISRAPDATLIVISASPARSADVGSANPGRLAAGASSRQADERLFAALRTHLEELMANAPGAGDDLANVRLEAMPARRFAYMRVTSDQDIEAALGVVASAIEQAGLVNSDAPHVVHLTEGGYLAGYPYEDFGVAPEATALGAVQTGQLAAGSALRVPDGAPMAQPVASGEQLLVVARAAGLEPGALIEVRSQIAVVQAGDAPLNVGDVQARGRDVYLMVSGRTTQVSCILSAIEAGYGHCVLGQ
jgi:hypothetical protein